MTIFGIKIEEKNENIYYYYYIKLIRIGLL